MDSTDAIADALARAPRTVAALLAEMPAALLTRRPRPAKWSAHEHARHVALVDPIFRARLDRMLAEDTPLIVSYDPDADETPAALLGMELTESLAAFARHRAAFVERVRALGTADWARRAEHTEHSHYSVFVMLRHLALHDMLHAYRIEELLLKKAWAAEHGVAGSRGAGIDSARRRHVTSTIPRRRLLLSPLPAVCLALLVLASCERFRPGGPRKSQPAMVVQQMGDTKLTVTYNRPSARGRVLFGGIVPLGRPWDPGADEATTLTVSRDVRFGGRPLPSGTYSVWAVPDSATWTVILSRASRVPHTPYPEGEDALRVTAVPRRAPHMEALAFCFPVADSAQAVLALHWGETLVEVPIARR